MSSFRDFVKVHGEHGAWELINQFLSDVNAGKYIIDDGVLKHTNNQVVDKHIVEIATHAGIKFDANATIIAWRAQLSRSVSNYIQKKITLERSDIFGTFIK